MASWQPHSPPSIEAGFNGTEIETGSTIWFNANFKASGVPSGGAMIFFTGSIITINGTSYRVPDGQITFSPTASCATTNYSDGKWVTTIPVSGSDEIFLSGMALPVSVDIPGGAKVTWAGNFSSLPHGISLSWKWGAAVYTQFSGDYNLLNVKPTHSNACDINNSDHAGTPEAFKSSVTGGGRGGRGSNYTGSWSGTMSVD